METVLTLAILFGLVILPWLLKPIERAVPTEAVGWVREVLIIGFFVPLANLSDRFNSLSIKEDKLTKELAKVKKLREDEKVRLEGEVKIINEKYRNHLNDHNGKRKWWYLWRRVPVPTLSFIAPVQKDVNGKPKKSGAPDATYSIERDLPPDMKGDRVKIWTYIDKRNQAQIDAARGGNRNKGGSNQNNGNNSNNSGKNGNN